MTRQIDELDSLISADLIRTILAIGLDPEKSDYREAESLATANGREAISKALLASAQMTSEEGTEKGGVSGSAAIPVMVTARLASQAGIEVTINALSGVIQRSINQWLAEKAAGLNEDREAFHVSEAAKLWEAEKLRRKKEEERKEAEEDAQRWAEWDSLTEGEKAARTFEMASAWKTAATTTPAPQISPEEKQRIQQEKEAKEAEEEKQVLGEGAEKAKQAVINEFIESSVEKSILIVKGTHKKWIERRGGSDEIASEAASLGARVVAAYSLEGEPSQALNVLHGEVVGRATREAVDEVASWLANVVR
ncbi:MAG: hypothetical protein HKL80_02645 [Acidimicrobiales bacterium]|nr:hypothetical protein [Acidimicrobiales bacterium]